MAPVPCCQSRVLRQLLLLGAVHCVTAAIDRRAVVARHDVIVKTSSAGLDTANDVFSVGNGAFAFNADVTGMQTFNSSYTHLGVNTLADWVSFR